MRISNRRLCTEFSDPTGSNYLCMAGIELAALRIPVQCSNQLSYRVQLLRASWEHPNLSLVPRLQLRRAGSWRETAQQINAPGDEAVLISLIGDFCWIVCSLVFTTFFRWIVCSTPSRAHFIHIYMELVTIFGIPHGIDIQDVIISFKV
jgi:hypothetical protein